MTETGERIRWERNDDGSDVTSAHEGYIGTISEPMFFIFEPDDCDPRWILTSSLPGLPVVGRAERRAYGDDTNHLKAEAERWLERFVSSLGAVFPEESGEPEKPRGKPRAELDGYRPYHAADCPARTSYHGHECTCGGLEHPLWKPGDEPAVHAEPVPPRPADRESWPSADELAEMSMHDQEIWERRCADAETPGTSAPRAGTETTDA